MHCKFVCVFAPLLFLSCSPSLHSAYSVVVWRNFPFSPSSNTHFQSHIVIREYVACTQTNSMCCVYTREVKYHLHKFGSSLLELVYFLKYWCGWRQQKQRRLLLNISDDFWCQINWLLKCLDVDAAREYLWICHYHCLYHFDSICYLASSFYIQIAAGLILLLVDLRAMCLRVSGCISGQTNQQTMNCKQIRHMQRTIYKFLWSSGDEIILIVFKELRRSNAVVPVY